MKKKGYCDILSHNSDFSELHNTNSEKKSELHDKLAIVSYKVRIATLYIEILTL